MKKTFVFLLITCAIVFALNGCADSDFLTKEQKEHTEEKPQDVLEEEPLENGTDTNEKEWNQQEEIEIENEDGISEQIAPDIIPLDATTTKEEMTFREAIGLTDEMMPQLFQEQGGNYAYDLMNQVLEKQLYVEIYTILANRAENIILCSTDIETIDYIFQCVMNDHPEIFYVTGYTYTKYSINDQTKRVAFTGTYTMDRDRIRIMQERIDQYAVQCLKGMPDDADDYEKVKYVYEYLISHTDYDLQAEENQNICSVCVYGASVCQGYAKTMQYLLNQIGIPTTLVIGTVNTGEGHAWNLVHLEDGYYYVDVTWGDAFYQLEGNKGRTVGSDEIPKINYDYLCVTTDQLCTTHVIDNIVPMPRCVSMKSNYYVREGAYFRQYDMDGVEQLFRQAYESGQGFVTLKCSDRNIYRQMENNLIEEQVVFQFLNKSAKTIAYATNQEQMTFTFWL